MATELEPCNPIQLGTVIKMASRREYRKGQYLRRSIGFSCSMATVIYPSIFLHVNTYTYQNTFQSKRMEGHIVYLSAGGAIATEHRTSQDAQVCTGGRHISSWLSHECRTQLESNGAILRWMAIETSEEWLSDLRTWTICHCRMSPLLSPQSLPLCEAQPPETK